MPVVTVSRVEGQLISRSLAVFMAAGSKYCSATCCHPLPWRSPRRQLWTCAALDYASAVLALGVINLHVEPDLWHPPNVVLGIALLVYARHATDADTLTLSGPTLSVEQTHGSVCRTARFRAEWVSVEPTHGDGSLVELSGQGQRVRIGRFLRPEMRAAFAQELRLALRTARTAPAASPDSTA